MTDFGYREGFAQLGSYRAGFWRGLGFIYAPWGDECSPVAGTVNAWIAASAPIFVSVRMITAYEPVFVSRFPTRAAVDGGIVCAWPSVEAFALAAAGIAALV